MSQASDMVAEVKGLVAEIEKEVKSFEKQVESVGSVSGGPDAIHLNKMLIHGRIFQGDLRNRRGNVEDAELAEMEAAETAESAPAAEVSAGQSVEAPVSESAVETVAPAESAPDPAAGLVDKQEETS